MAACLPARAVSHWSSSAPTSALTGNLRHWVSQVDLSLFQTAIDAALLVLDSGAQITPSAAPLFEALQADCDSSSAGGSKTPGPAAAKDCIRRLEAALGALCPQLAQCSNDVQEVASVRLLALAACSVLAVATSRMSKELGMAWLRLLGCALLPAACTTPVLPKLAVRHGTACCLCWRLSTRSGTRHVMPVA